MLCDYVSLEVTYLECKNFAAWNLEVLHQNSTTLFDAINHFYLLGTMEATQPEISFLSDVASVTQEFYASQVADIFVKKEDALGLEVRCTSADDFKTYQKNGQPSLEQITSGRDTVPSEQSPPPSGVPAHALQIIDLDITTLGDFLKVSDEQRS